MIILSTRSLLTATSCKIGFACNYMEKINKRTSVGLSTIGFTNKMYTQIDITKLNAKYFQQNIILGA